jgi:DNA-binding transcriptional ArsR family regulator
MQNNGDVMSDSFYKAIADKHRRRILSLLRKNGTMAAGEIAKNFEISLPALSEHLKVLRNADLVSARKHKQFVLYTLNTTVFEDVASWIKELTDKKEVENDETE